MNGVNGETLIAEYQFNAQKTKILTITFMVIGLLIAGWGVLHHPSQASTIAYGIGGSLFCLSLIIGIKQYLSLKQSLIQQLARFGIFRYLTEADISFLKFFIKQGGVLNNEEASLVLNKSKEEYENQGSMQALKNIKLLLEHCLISPFSVEDNTRFFREAVLLNDMELVLFFEKRGLDMDALENPRRVIKTGEITKLIVDTHVVEDAEGKVREYLLKNLFPDYYKLD